MSGGWGLPHPAKAVDTGGGVPDNGAVRRSLVHRLSILALLVAWLAPGTVALAIALHLDLHHGERAGELALAVEHGHSHAVADAEHEHPGTWVETVRAALDPIAAGATGVGPNLSEAREPGAVPGPSPPLRPPRPALFTLHCALLC